jgi:hypothetical protein
VRLQRRGALLRTGLGPVKQEHAVYVATALLTGTLLWCGYSRFAQDEERKTAELLAEGKRRTDDDFRKGMAAAEAIAERERAERARKTAEPPAACHDQTVRFALDQLKLMSQAAQKAPRSPDYSSPEHRQCMGRFMLVKRNRDEWLEKLRACEPSAPGVAEAIEACTATMHCINCSMDAPWQCPAALQQIKAAESALRKAAR